MTIRPADFRNIPFGFIDSSFSTGKEDSDESIPLKEPVSQSTAKVPKKFSINAVIIGEDVSSWKQKRDSFNKALDRDESGILTHPYWGKLRVNAKSYSIKESYDKKRASFYSIEFELATAISYPTEKESSPEKIKEASNKLTKKSSEVFQKKFSVDGQPQFVKDDAISRVGNYVNDIESKVNSLKQEGQVFAQVAFKIREARANAQDFINLPSSLADNITSSFDELKKLNLSKAEMIAAYTSSGASIISSSSVVATTPARTQQINNQKSFSSFIESQNISAKADALTALIDSNEINSREELNGLVADLDISINGQLESVDDDELFQALLKVQTEVRKYAQSDLAINRVVEYKTVGPINAIALIYEIDGNLDNIKDLITRNSISNSLTIPGGTTVKVVAKGE